MDVQFIDTETKRLEALAIRASVIMEIRAICGNCKKLTKLEREKYHMPAKRIRKTKRLR